MKKSLAKFMTFAALTGMLTCTTALADNEIKYSTDDEGNINVTVSVTAAAEETTLLVIPTNTTIEQAFADTTKVYYINQAAADAEKTAHFKFTAPTTGDYTIYSGYATMSPTAEPFEQVLDLSSDPIPGKDYIYGDVNNDAEVDLFDAKAIIDYYLKDAVFEDIETGEEYDKALLAAEVMGDEEVDLFDAKAIIDYYLKDAQLPVLAE